MDNKKMIALLIVGVLVIGGFSMLLGGMRGSSSTNTQSEESRTEMMSRMHPNQQPKNDMVGHHTSTPVSDTSSTDKLVFSEVVGKPAPDFTLTDQDGSTFTLSDYKDKTVVLFFNGGAMCYPACWNQIAVLGEDERFNNDDVVTASIVVDSKEKWDKIIRSQPKYGVGTILFDTEKEVSQAYDMLYAPSSMHKGSFPGHTYLIIKKGIISYVLDDPKMALNTGEVASKL